MAPARIRDDKVVVYFGLIAPRKGIEDFLRLVRLAQDHGYGWDFRIIGRIPHKRKPYAHALREASRELSLSWHLDLAEDDVADQLAGASAAYLPFPDGASSRRGSLAAVLVNGLPTVTTHGAATPRELVDEEVLMFADSAEEALVRIRRVISDEQLSQTLSSGALRYAERLSWGRIAEQHAALYLDVAGSNWAMESR